MSKNLLSAEQFDRKFDQGEDVSEHLDIANASKRVIVDIPLWMLKEIDQETARLGIPRQALLKTWIDERLDRIRARYRDNAG